MPGVQWGHWGHLACLALQPNSIPEEEYEELNVKWCNKEVRHELEIMKHIQRELGTWDRGQSRGQYRNPQHHPEQGMLPCPAWAVCAQLTRNSPNPALISPRTHFWVKNKDTQELLLCPLQGPQPARGNLCTPKSHWGLADPLHSCRAPFPVITPLPAALPASLADWNPINRVSGEIKLITSCACSSSFPFSSSQHTDLRRRPSRCSEATPALVAGSERMALGW